MKLKSLTAVAALMTYIGAVSATVAAGDEIRREDYPTYTEYANAVAKSNQAKTGRVAFNLTEALEQSEQATLKCISAGGRPIMRRLPEDIQRRFRKKDITVYERCVEKQVIVQQAPAYQPTWTPLPYPNIKFEPRTRCTTTCNGNQCTTNC